MSEKYKNSLCGIPCRKNVTNKNSEIYICPYCGSEVEVSDGNCWHCPNCGMGECGISEDMVVDENTRLIVKLFGPAEGLERIRAFLERIGYPKDHIEEKARELWNEWLASGHWWPPSRKDLLLFLEGEV